MTNTLNTIVKCCVGLAPIFDLIPQSMSNKVCPAKTKNNTNWSLFYKGSETFASETSSLTKFYRYQQANLDGETFFPTLKIEIIYYALRSFYITFSLFTIWIVYTLFTIAKPTSAIFKAGPSFVPSPVTATTSRLAESLLSMIPLTNVYLSVGDDRANTRKRGQTLSTNSCLTSPF
uniref:Uncharacterized protein n=1 Tax=Romanomermis culicivorax TaxID=13658 RepID=A0A915JBM4_ROMCU